MSEEEKKIRDEATVVHLLSQLSKGEVKDDPLKTIACLFMLKRTLEKSLTPRLAYWCSEHDIVSILMTLVDAEFNPLDGNEGTIYSLVAETLCLLSSISRPYVDPMFSCCDHIDLLARLLDISSRFYRFGPTFHKRFARLCRQRLFPLQQVSVLPLEKQIWNDLVLYEPKVKVCYGPVRPSRLHCCRLVLDDQDAVMAMSTAPRKVGNVAWRLVNEDLAWTVPGDAPNDWEVLFDSIRDLVHPPNDRTAMISSPLLASPLQDDLPETSLPSPKINNAAADWHLEDVHVLEVIGGRYFWAYVGRKGMEKVKSITDDLLKALPSLQPCPRARVGAMVVVVAAEEKRSGQDEPIAVMRGRVVGVDGDEVTVFAMDHGSLKQVRMGEVYQLSEPVEHLYTAEAQAKLCCLAGVQAPPASVQAVEFALVTLTCLTRLSFSAGIMFTEMSDLDHVCHLMQCGPPSIRLQATRLLCNLSSIPKLSASLNWSRFVRPILERLVVLSQRQSLLKELDNLHRNMVVASLFSLTNIMYHKPANHRLMLHLQGHMVLLNLLRVSKGHYPAVCQAVVCALKPLYPNLRFLGWEESHMCDIRDDKEPESTEGRSPADQPTELNEDSVNDIQVFSDDEITYEMQRRMPLPLGEADEEEEGEGGPDGSSSGVSLPGPSSGTVAEKTGESETSVRLVPVDGAAVFKKSGRFYVYGTSVPVQDDQTHHLVPGTSIRNMGFDGILKIICGMLNSEGGIIYLGLTKEGRVQGLPLNREDRDCVRLGVDEMMNKLVPSVPFNQIRVYCIPVLSTSCGGVCDYDGGGVAAGGSDGDELEPLGNRVVVEIHVKSPKEMQFHMKDNWCFQRIGPVLHSLTEQEVRALVISQETKKYLPQLWSLQGRLHCLQQALQ